MPERASWLEMPSARSFTTGATAAAGSRDQARERIRVKVTSAWMAASPDLDKREDWGHGWEYTVGAGAGAGVVILLADGVRAAATITKITTITITITITTTTRITTTTTAASWRVIANRQRYCSVCIPQRATLH